MEVYEAGDRISRHYDAQETQDEFVPLRDRIFDCEGGGAHYSSDRVFRDPAWSCVIIRGAWYGSDRRTGEYGSSLLKEPVPRDDRDELQPLFDILAEDHVKELIHLRPYTGDLADFSDSYPGGYDAVGELPTREATTYIWGADAFAQIDSDRLIIDRTARWGFYCDVEEFGVLGGEPAFMDRYAEKAGGWDFIRERADAYWQWVVDTDDYEAPWVPDYYRVAGWDNPPVKRPG